MIWTDEEIIRSKKEEGLTCNLLKIIPHEDKETYRPYYLVRAENESGTVAEYEMDEDNPVSFYWSLVEGEDVVSVDLLNWFAELADADREMFIYARNILNGRDGEYRFCAAEALSNEEHPCYSAISNVAAAVYSDFIPGWSDWDTLDDEERAEFDSYEDFCEKTREQNEEILEKIKEKILKYGYEK